MRSRRFPCFWHIAFTWLALVALSSYAEVSDDQAAIQWLREHAVPLQTVEAGHGFADLQPLGKMVGNARIVELGEATHGSREFFQLKHRLIEFLASQKGFTIFSIEANMPEAYRLNDFVLNGTGDPKQLLKGMYFWTWDTQEVLDMILWMRDYNKSGRGRIEFTGFDMQTSTVAIDIVRKFVRSNDPNFYSTTLDPLYSELPALQPSTPKPSAVATAGDKESASILLAGCNRVANYLESSRARYLKQGATDATIDWVIQNARLVLEYTQLKTGVKTRDESMAENVKWIADHNPGAKIILWAHNGHVSNTGYARSASMGSYLRKTFGSELINFGFAFNQGTFQAGEVGKGVHDFTVGPAPDGSLDRTLAGVRLPVFAVDFRTLPKHGPVARWFLEPHPSRSIGAIYSDTLAPSLWSNSSANGDFDVLLFVEKTTAARPNH
jgi:erythromycin esterase